MYAVGRQKRGCHRVRNGDGERKGGGVLCSMPLRRADQLVGECTDAIGIWQFVESLLNGSPGFAEVHKEVFAGGSDIEGVSWGDDS
jgi:hypothetical protein